MLAGRTPNPQRATMPALPHSRTIPAALTAQPRLSSGPPRRAAPQPVRALGGAGPTAAEIVARRGSLQKLNAAAAAPARPAVADTESKMVEGPIVLNGQVSSRTENHPYCNRTGCFLVNDLRNSARNILSERWREGLLCTIPWRLRCCAVPY